MNITEERQITDAKLTAMSLNRKLGHPENGEKRTVTICYVLSDQEYESSIVDLVFDGKSSTWSVVSIESM
jgi:hypothetical protein